MSTPKIDSTRTISDAYIIYVIIETVNCLISSLKMQQFFINFGACYIICKSKGLTAKKIKFAPTKIVFEAFLV
jgi:hypothetical protein